MPTAIQEVTNFTSASAHVMSKKSGDLLLKMKTLTLEPDLMNDCVDLLIQVPKLKHFWSLTAV